MTTKHFYIILLIISGAMTSCRKYVEVEQYNQRVFKYTSDYQALLNNRTEFEASGASLTMISSDDVNLDSNVTKQNLLTNGYDNIYIWAADYYTSDQSDAGWDLLYNQIYVCNQITENVMSSENGTTEAKQKIYAEAQVQRAYSYLTLINLYARVYNTANAAKDPGVPMLLTTDLFASLTRASVQQVYDQILQDLTQALPVLPSYPANKVHPAKAATYALLARTYLYMQRYSEAADNASKALALQSDLLDLNTYVAGTAYPRRLDNAEVIMAKQFYKPGFLDLPLSQELLNKFSADDLRYQLFTRSGTSFQPAFTGRGSYRDKLFSGDNITVGVSVPEMMLTQAEGLARDGQTDAAMDLVNALRQKRFSPATYVALSAATADEALHIVLDERRRELFGTGLRWFDQRRLSIEPALAETETRTFKGTTYTLVPGDRYVYPIPPKNIEQNPELIQNAR